MPAGHQLSERPAEAEVEDAEVANKGPRKSQQSESIKAKALDSRWNGNYGYDQRCGLAREIPQDIGGQKPRSQRRNRRHSVAIR